MKKLIKIAIYILIITLFLHKIQLRQTNAEPKKAQYSILVSSIPYNCTFERRSHFFKVPGCRDYKPGTILQITGFEEGSFSRKDTLFDTAFFDKKRLIIESIVEVEDGAVSLDLWLEHLFFIFQTKKEFVLTKFLPIFNAKGGYLIGRLSLGFSQVRLEEVDRLFKVTGMQYLASISGFHLNLVVKSFTNLAKKIFKKKIVAVLALVVSGLYLLLVGPKIPLVRAFLMLIFSVISTSFLLRQNSSMHSLLLIAISLIYIDISIINSISFQLSFIATASIIFFTNTFGVKKNFKSNKLANLHLSDFSNSINNYKNTHISDILSTIRRYLMDSIKIGVYVQLAILPLVIYHFGEFSIISLIVSIALTWLVPGIIILAFVLIGVSLLEVNKEIFKILSLPLSFLSKIFLFILELFNNQIFIIKIDIFPWWGVIIWWLVVIVITKLFVRKKQFLPLVRCI